MNKFSASTEPRLQSDREAIRLFLDGLRQHRLKQNWSQVEMARRAGLSRPAYQNFENGYGNITLRNLLMIPPVTEEPTLAALSKPVRQRARRRRQTVGSPASK